MRRQRGGGGGGGRLQQAPAMAPATVVKAKPRTARNRVVVTGGAGFVGSHLCEYLVERGDYVRRALPAPPPSPACLTKNWSGDRGAPAMAGRRWQISRWR